MAEWRMPFAPPQHYQAEETVAEVQVVKREWDPNHFLLCTHCELPITHGKPGMSFEPGVSGWGSKSGRPMLVWAEDMEHERADLHIDCIYDYVFNLEETRAYADEEIVLCHLCGDPLVGEAPRFCANCGAEAPR